MPISPPSLNKHVGADPFSIGLIDRGGNHVRATEAAVATPESTQGSPFGYDYPIFDPDIQINTLVGTDTFVQWFRCRTSANI